jgi:PhzF family phenazine biosynthesis protein
MLNDYPVFVVDAFTTEPFRGNPAAVVPLVTWLDDATLQAMAAEHNLSETAFFVPRAGGDGYDLRWFTPTDEVQLCGHATLASGHILLKEQQKVEGEVVFHTRFAGELRVGADPVTGQLRMDLPSALVEPYGASEAVLKALGAGRSQELVSPHAQVVVLDSEAELRALKPDFSALGDALRAGNLFAVIATAKADPGSTYDVAARFFAPTKGVPEDPVTGSMWAVLTPFWAERLGSDRFEAFQASARGGRLSCERSGERAILRGDAVTYLRGTARLPSPASGFARRPALQE